jgi:hypothetical protein
MAVAEAAGERDSSMGPQPLPAGEMLQPRRRPVVGVHHTWTAGGGAFTETGLMFRCFVMRLVSLAVVRKRAGRGESGPVAAKAPRRMRGPGRALSSNVRASCGRPVLCSSVAIYCLQARAPLDFETPQVGVYRLRTDASKMRFTTVY